MLLVSSRYGLYCACGNVWLKVCIEKGSKGSCVSVEGPFEVSYECQFQSADGYH